MRFFNKIHDISGCLNSKATLLFILWLAGFQTQVHGQKPQTINTLDSLNFEYEKTRKPEKRINTLLNIADYYEKSDLVKSQEYTEKALVEAENLGNDSIISKANMHMGYRNFNVGLYEPAVKNFSRHIEIEKKRNNSLGVSNAMVNLAAVRIRMEDFENAKHYLLEALKMYELQLSQSPDSSPLVQLITVYNNLGIVFQNQKQYAEAVDYYNRGISLALGVKNIESTLAMLYNNLGTTLLDEGKPSSALESFNKSLSIRKKANDKQGLASSYRNLALYHSAVNQRDSVYRYLHQSLSLARLVGDASIESNISEKLFQYYKVKNVYDSALFYLINFQEIESRIKKDETLKELSRIELTAQFQEREHIRREEQLKREYWFILISLLLLSLLIIVGMLYFLSRSRLKRVRLEKLAMELRSSNLELKKESLEKELEIKNKELTTHVMYKIKQNELINDIAQNLIKQSQTFRKENQDFINTIIKELEKSHDDSAWSEFEIRFQQVHNSFYDKLNALCPDLSTNERRLCAFLKLNMSTKEISSITGQSPRSIDVARTRLRKKLNLTNNDSSLSDFLSSL